MNKEKKYAGHGYRETTPDKDHYYLIPADHSPKRFDETTIDGATFTQKIKALPAQKVLVLLDCCHAGGLTEIKSIEKKVNLAPLPLETRALLAQGKGYVVIASSQEEELSFAGRPYSAFTLAIVEAFCGVGVAKHDGHVRVADLALHTREVVPRRTKGKQHPILHFEQADNFVLAYYAAGAPQSKGLPFSTSIEIEPTAGSWRFPLADIERSPKPSLGKLDYLGALERFHELISKQSPGLQSDFLVYENRLRENLVRERRYGSTETVRAERSEIVDRLNDLAQQAKLGISFNDLAGNTSSQIARGDKAHL